MKFKNAYVLTGGIGTGKSTVSSFLKMFGYKIIDADEISKEVFNKHIKEIENIFNTTDRKKIRDIVFKDKNKLQQLEDIILPEVKREILKKALILEKDNIPYFVDLPLYFEKQNYPEFDKVVVVYAPKELQLKRASKRDKSSVKDIENIINNQMDIEEKKLKADYVIDNSKDLKYLQKEIENFLKRIEKETT